MNLKFFFFAATAIILTATASVRSQTNGLASIAATTGKVSAQTISSDGTISSVTVNATRPRVVPTGRKISPPKPEEMPETNETNSTPNKQETSTEKGFTIDLPTTKGTVSVTRTNDRKVEISFGGRRIRIFR